MSHSLTQGIATLAAVGVAAMMIFQILLAAGLPLGHAAFGGAYRVLPRSMRFASALSAVIFCSAFFVILARGDLLGEANHSSSLARLGIWVLVVILSASTVVNLVSRSRWERRLMAPVALILAICCLMLALS